VLEKSFDRIYTKFKLHFYRAVFTRFQTREASLTAVETFCMEIIRALDEPTINEFASFANISSPNAAYKVNSLIRKGYVEKVQSPSDRREYHLRPTQKFHDYYNLSSAYVRQVMERVRERFTPEEVAQIDHVLEIVGQELMPEVNLRQ
jgi:DNA-binding MarR family transcriptional regulator